MLPQVITSLKPRNTIQVINLSTVLAILNIRCFICEIPDVHRLMHLFSAVSRPDAIARFKLSLFFF